MTSLYSRPITLSAPTSHLCTSRLPARACSAGLPSPLILRARSAVHPIPSLIRGRTIGGSKGELPLGGGGCGGGGSGSGKPGCGDEDDRSGEGFRLLKWLLRRLLKLGVKGPLLAGDILAVMHSSISFNINPEEMQSPPSSPSSNSTREINGMGDEEGHCDGSSDDETKVIMPVLQDNHSDRSSRNSSNRNEYITRTAEVGTRTTNSQNHSVDMDISDDETLLEDEKQIKPQSRQKKNQILQSRKKKNQILQSRKKKNQSRKKMEGTRSQVSNTANSLLAGALALLPYWGICCSDPNLSISKIWKDALYIAYIFLFIITITVSALSSRFKDAKLPVDSGFKLLEIVQLLLLLFFCVAAFIPQHVCRGVSIWAICPSIGALFMIVIACGTDFQKKTAIECIKAPCQMVTECTKFICQKIWQWLPRLSLPECIKVIRQKVRQWLPHLSLPEFIQAKFMKVPEKQIRPGLPMELV